MVSMHLARWGLAESQSRYRVWIGHVIMALPLHIYLLHFDLFFNELRTANGLVLIKFPRLHQLPKVRLGHKGFFLVKILRGCQDHLKKLVFKVSPLLGVT